MCINWIVTNLCYYGLILHSVDLAGRYDHYHTIRLIINRETFESGGLFKSCRFITIMHARLNVPAKNSSALLFLSRAKAADCCCFSFFFFSPAKEEQSKGILGGNFQTRAHDGNKAAGS